MNTTSIQLKRIYKRMSVREKLLCLLFCLTLLFIWANNWTSRATVWNDTRISTANDLKVQQQWIDRSDSYTEGLAEALERVDPSKTFSAAQLSGKIDSIIRKASLQGDMDPVKTSEREIFNEYDVRVRLSRISIAQLININSLLKQEAPYINIESVRINASRKNQEQLDARLEINSFDLNIDTLQN